jgi:hypothetical protein
MAEVILIDFFYQINFTYLSFKNEFIIDSVDMDNNQT